MSVAGGVGNEAVPTLYLLAGGVGNMAERAEMAYALAGGGGKEAN
jgi:hypothetical protein